MQRMRHIAAVMTYLLMIPLTIMSSSVACPMAGSAFEHTMPGAMMGATAGAVHPSADRAPATPASSSATPHETSHAPGPQQQQSHHPGSHCPLPCTSAAGCTMGVHCTSVANRVSEPLHGLLHLTSVHTSTRTDALHSVSTAPEPPPPRV